MQIDLRKDAKQVAKYLARRCKDYPVYVNAGPGKDEDDIRLITLGFGFEQSGWIALVFDTRPKAKFDGTWNSYIEQNAEPFDHWFEAYDDVYENESVLTLIEHDGTKHQFNVESETEEIASCFGRMLRDALQTAQKKGLFKKLPLAATCKLAVEEDEGNYGWVEKDPNDKSIDRDEVKSNMRRVARKLSQVKQIAYWIDQLEHLAAGKSCEASQLTFEADEFVMNELAAIGKPATIPLLTWANTWADKPEFKPLELINEDDDCDYPSQDICCMVFWEVDKWGARNPEVERLIQQYIRTAMKVKPAMFPTARTSKKLKEIWGIVPWHAAELLHSAFKGYPKPKTQASTNQLLNADQFTGETR